MRFIKRTLPAVTAFLSGFIVIVAFFAGPGFPRVKAIEEDVWKWLQIIISFSAPLGAVSLLQVNISKIRGRADGWGYNLTLVSGFLIMSALGFVTGMENSPAAGRTAYLMGASLEGALPVTIVDSEKDSKGNETFRVRDSQGETTKCPGKRLKSSWMFHLCLWQQFFFLGVFKAGQATMSALLAFFVASAAFRAFRIKSREAFVLTTSAFLVMLGNIPIGNLLTHGFSILGLPWMDIGAMKEWILTYPSSAAQSAILIGAVLGYISAALKVILGIERSYLGEGR